MRKVNRTTAQPDREGDVLSDLVRQNVGGTQYGQRWLDSARRGFAMHRLREERGRHGFLALPVWEYLAALAKQAHISLDTALAAFELDARPVVGRGTAGRVAEVLHRIGCAYDEALHMIRLSFAEVHGFTVKTELAVVHRAGARSSDLAACEEALGRVERRYSAGLLFELHDIKTAVAGAYARECSGNEPATQP